MQPGIFDDHLAGHWRHRKSGTQCQTPRNAIIKTLFGKNFPKYFANCQAACSQKPHNVIKSSSVHQIVFFLCNILEQKCKLCSIFCQVFFYRANMTLSWNKGFVFKLYIFASLFFCCSLFVVLFLFFALHTSTPICIFSTLSSHLFLYIHFCCFAY